MLKDKCGLSRCRLAPGRCGVPATLYWRQTRFIVVYPEWHATLAQQHRGSLANGTAQGDGIRRAGYGLARFPSFPQNVAAWEAVQRGHQHFLDGSQAKNHVRDLLASVRGD